MLQAIIFDLDGVLADTEPQYFESARRMVAEQGGVLTMQSFSRFFGTSPTVVWTTLKEEYGFEQPIEALIERFVATRNQIVKDEGLVRFPGVEEAIGQLKEAGYLLAVASGSPVLRQTLQQLGLESYFSAFANTAECTHTKPWPDVFLLAAERLEVAPKNCLVVEDGVNGMIAAGRAGMACVGFSGSKFPSDMSPVTHSFSSYCGLTAADFERFYEVSHTVAK